MLIVDTHPQAGISANISLGCIDLSGQKFQESRFTSTIRTNHTDSAIHIYTEIDLVENDGMFLRVPKVYICDLHNGSREFWNLREFELDGVFFGPFDEFLDLSGLRSRGDSLVLFLLTSGTSLALLVLFNCFLSLVLRLALSLQLTESLLLLLVGPDLLLEAVCLGLFEAIVVALVRNKLQIFDVQDFLAYTVQEILVVGNDEQGLLPGLKIIVEPDDSV
mmetsp:Transcript_7446/g.18272  ORF Transcript_7446/g.18272 Transcript_7446/m.18272 type:complete len:220 (+) Transcript_7446:580-1239(+)